MLSFFKRANLTKQALAQRWLKLMDQKQSNLCVAIDTISQEKLLTLAETLGPEICVLKTHIDIIEDYSPDVTHKLRQIAHNHQFLLFEDRQFADIGPTVSLQYTKGIYRIAEWADLINAHPLPGPGVIEELKKGGENLQRGLLLIAEMRSSNNLFHSTYTKKTVNMAEMHPDFVIGFISQKKLSNHPGMIHCTPGVKLHTGINALGQRYPTVEEVLIKQQSDVIIVGKDITETRDPLGSAREYRERAWRCYADALS